MAEAARGTHYKWIALSNTTIGILMATINSSILLIALPDIFRGIELDPLAPENTSYFLWILMGFMLVTSVLVVSLGRIGDMFGRVRMYNAGFLVFTIASIGLSVVPSTGSAGALELIFGRIVQGIGGALLMANSTAILTDAFPQEERGMALGINMVAGIAGSFIGLVVGGLVSEIDWRLVFLVSVPVGVFGTVWAYLKLEDVGERVKARTDWWGNATLAVGLVAILVGITYGIQPYGGHTMGWTNPVVMAEIIGGVGLLLLFAWIETRVPEPMCDLGLFRIRAFSNAGAANLLSAVGRGGLQFILIIWLQGIWLPLHGYSFERTPLWAGIYMVPLSVGFLLSGPVAGFLSDRFGNRPFSVGGMVLASSSFALLMLLPTDFGYVGFAALLFVNGIGNGLFAAPNTTSIMNSVPAAQRGSASGVRATFMNTGFVLSIGLFFSLMIAGLAARLPAAMHAGLVAQGVPAADASRAAGVPPVGSLFAAFLGNNPMRTLLGPHVLGALPASRASYITGKSFFPSLISGPFHFGLVIAFSTSAVMCAVAALASWRAGSGREPQRRRAEPAIDELAAAETEAWVGA